MSQEIDAIRLCYDILDGSVSPENISSEEVYAICTYLDEVVRENLTFTQQNPVAFMDSEGEVISAVKKEFEQLTEGNHIGFDIPLIQINKQS
ncbi:TPA: hypothetical protein SMV75_000546 [Proteus mirabilis]|uniref:hypothetical protein n=1 Tax=Proteus mirabilis TaxID=584 RepID=UPI000DFDF83C|nr:hypothetical protein [Proteus mirabilis]MBG3043591.1 hypothetical protein [Proteus mirabilis]MBG3051094.1 hypothetical protein [Proteus mirabilis]MBG5962318.1 hypothetical protein [Proteus mirabilis]MBL1381492.1 hypothetical protein [Proteus mirabilis]MCR1830203.1 hypothetical protein [Proteus mirabilis]